MISRISNKFIEDFVKSKVIEEDDREIYLFGLEQLLLTVFNIVHIFMCVYNC